MERRKREEEAWREQVDKERKESECRVKGLQTELGRAREQVREVKEELHIFVREREKEKQEVKGMMESL